MAKREGMPCAPDAPSGAASGSVASIGKPGGWLVVMKGERCRGSSRAICARSPVPLVATAVRSGSRPVFVKQQQACLLVSAEKVDHLQAKG